MEELFALIYKTYFDDVFRLVYSYTLNTQDTEDILQKVFVKLYKNINKFEKVNDDVKKWLFRVASNDAKSLLTSSWNKKVIHSDTLENSSNLKYSMKDNELLEVLISIPKKYRIPLYLYLYYYEGYSIKEIANILKMNESTTKSRLQRGKDKIII